MKATEAHELEALRAKRNEYMRNFYAKNAESVKARANAYRLANREKVLAAKKVYREANPEKVAAGKRGFYLRNRAAVIAKQQARWRVRDVEAARAIKRERRLRNHAAELGKERVYARRRYAEDIQFRLANVLRARMRGALRSNHRAGSAVRDLGCSIVEFRDYLAAKFAEGMTWANWGEWHIDHIRPLSSFDLTDRAQFLRAAHFTNMQPLWAHENLAKGAKLEGF